MSCIADKQNSDNEMRIIGKEIGEQVPEKAKKKRNRARKENILPLDVQFSIKPKGISSNQVYVGQPDDNESIDLGFKIDEMSLNSMSLEDENRSYQINNDTDGHLSAASSSSRLSRHVSESTSQIDSNDPNDIESLRNEMFRLRSQLKVYQKENVSYKEKLSAAEKKLEEAVQRLKIDNKRLNKECEKLKEKVAALQTELSDKEDECRRINCEKTAFSDRLQTLDKENQRLQQTFANDESSSSTSQKHRAICAEITVLTLQKNYEVEMKERIVNDVKKTIAHLDTIISKCTGEDIIATGKYQEKFIEIRRQLESDIKTTKKEFDDQIEMIKAGALLNTLKRIRTPAPPAPPPLLKLKAFERDVEKKKMDSEKVPNSTAALTEEPSSTAPKFRTPLPSKPPIADGLSRPIDGGHSVTGNVMPPGQPYSMPPGQPDHMSPGQPYSEPLFGPSGIQPTGGYANAPDFFSGLGFMPSQPYQSYIYQQPTQHMAAREYQNSINNAAQYFVAPGAPHPAQTFGMRFGQKPGPVPQVLRPSNSNPQSGASKASPAGIVRETPAATAPATIRPAITAPQLKLGFGRASRVKPIGMTHPEPPGLSAPLVSLNSSRPVARIVPNDQSTDDRTITAKSTSEVDQKPGAEVDKGEISALETRSANSPQKVNKVDQVWKECSPMFPAATYESVKTAILNFRNQQPNKKLSGLRLPQLIAGVKSILAREFGSPISVQSASIVRPPSSISNNSQGTSISDLVVNQSAPPECFICYEPLNMYECLKLECQHEAHKRCLEEWITENKTCPYCRKYALSEDDFPRL